MKRKPPILYEREHIIFCRYSNTYPSLYHYVGNNILLYLRTFYLWFVVCLSAFLFTFDVEDISSFNYIYRCIVRIGSI